MIKTFKFRLYPTRAQETAMNAMIEAHRALYNSALNERKFAYETTKKSVGYVQQAGWLKGNATKNWYFLQGQWFRRVDRAAAIWRGYESL